MPDNRLTVRRRVPIFVSIMIAEKAADMLA
jgi:hypothetical protein